MYISPVDILKISADALMTLDKKGFLRLEKQLKAEMLTSGRETYNPQQFDTLLSQLRNDNKKKSIFFIEKHPGLKQFITDGTDIGPKTFSIDQNLLQETPHLREFLAPYFEVFFMAMVKRNFKSGRYDTIAEALKTDELFTETILNTYSQFITQQLDVVVEKIKAVESGQLIKNFPYLHYSSFIHVLNTVSLGYIKKSKIAYVNALLYYFDNKRKSYELEKLELILSNFIHIKVDDSELQNHLVRLAIKANIGQEKGFSYGLRSVIVIVLIVFAIIRIGLLIDRSNSTDHTPNFQIENQNNYTLENTLKTMGKKSMNSLFSDIMFYAENPLDSSFEEKRLIHNGNPYRNLAKAFLYQKNTKPVHDITTSNQRNTEPIVVLVHTQTEGILKSIAIGPKRQASIRVRKGERLSFYVGSNWVKKDSIDSNGYNKTTMFFKELSTKQLDIFKESYSITSAGKNATITIYEDYLVFKNIETKTWHKNSSREAFSDQAQEMKQSADDEIEETVTITKIPEKKPVIKKVDNKLWYKSKRKFIRNLEDYFESNDSLVSFDFNVLTGDNPYPNVFLKITDSHINGTMIPIENYSDKEDMVLFVRNLSAKRDRAAFIEKKGVAEPALIKGDTLTFYMGTSMRTINPQNGQSNLNLNLPYVFFEENTEEAKALFKKRFIIKAIGEDPRILVTGKDAGFKDLQVKRL